MSPGFHIPILPLHSGTHHHHTSTDPISPPASHNTTTQIYLPTHLPSPNMSSHPIYLIASLGAPRNHHAIFVESGPLGSGSGSGSGTLFHVRGNIQTGMTYETRPSLAKPDLADGRLCVEEADWRGTCP
ncbi:hypothetical protein CONLIGDRAFT_636706 [Coniochaeta ligniaria NRRL 30616]|uniref:Uncharacterized protein n=1 Tax=Coniochaeta ligniaria NRRL 30616 TaxID=1408157 RepID=A0A1J7JAD6_9PEZI|nr:hypothetical protein CONLIGDRAFT_636706 [Coniochaeta ligniaria NRRL 30616]